MSDEKNIKLFDYYLVLSEVELLARQEVALEQYEMAIDIEAETLENMAPHDDLASCDSSTC